MTIYTTLDDRNLASAMYHDNIHSTIPDGAIEIPDDIFTQVIAGQQYQWEHNTQTWVSFTEPASVLIEEARRVALCRCKGAFRKIVNSGLLVTDEITLDCSPESILNLESAIALERELGNVYITIRDYDNNVMDILIDLLQSWITTLKTNYKAILNAKWSACDYINSPDRTLEELQTYEWK